MKNVREDIQRLEKELRACQKILTAIGDETRQHLLCIMLQRECSGSRVIEFAEKTNLSRPAVSHYMQILKDAGIVKSRKESTCVSWIRRPARSII
ncbi:MAG TPA: ArsR family transcriptional regulator [Candidatus Blautia stercoripullorum]|uniref:ArsR family transcriptional regulator n=1 Tax=Candidatus Blautia stercoripullorum TaxID=2838502 RepID=A0A9D2RCE3_9FIRM|nr:ArsR family transcriptional regulator [Candidatus Blautia stercoripullorum]